MIRDLLTALPTTCYPIRNRPKKEAHSEARKKDSALPEL
jgi:hypothetical protein